MYCFGTCIQHLLSTADRYRALPKYSERLYQMLMYKFPLCLEAVLFVAPTPTKTFVQPAPTVNYLHPIISHHHPRHTNASSSFNHRSPTLLSRQRLMYPADPRGLMPWVRHGRRRLAPQPGRANSLRPRSCQGLARLRPVVQAAVGDRGRGGDGDFFCGVAGEVCVHMRLTGCLF